ncbi:MAG TPA: NF038122 family metalloprotease [Candidatus Paceibacterota bacterium]|nr:NF038122 family metalloprotease [Candidatus Paceibacterota bacterium]
MKTCPFRASAVHVGIKSAALALFAASSAHGNLNFNLIPEAGMPQYAIDGFNAAAAMWSQYLANNVTVNIQIGYAALAANVIGETSSSLADYTYAQTVQALGNLRTSADDYTAYANLQSGNGYTRIINHTSNSPNGANSATPYLDTMNRVGISSANAKVLGLVPQDSSIDATIRFSSNFSFDFNHAGPINPGQMDFVGVAAHEIGHALGFISGVDDIDYLNGTYADNAFSSDLLDLFRYSPLSLSMSPGATDYAADTRGKYFSLDGGTTAIAEFSTGVNFGDGSQASHWKDSLGIGIMDPTAGYGEKLDISAIDLRAMDALGYQIVPEPGSAAMLTVGFTLMAMFRRRK